MSPNLQRVVLLLLLAAWMLIAWPHVSEQYSNTERVRAALASLSWEDRAAALDQPGYRVAREIAAAAPSGACVLVLTYTGPARLRYYRSRFPYYLYPRRVRLSDHSTEAIDRCDYLAVFRDSRQSLAQEPFRGHWDERQLAERTTKMTKIFGGSHVEIFRSPNRP